MALPAISYDVETVTCYKCGISFSVPQHWKASRHEDHSSFFCPNGHEQAFCESEKDRALREKATEIEKLRKQLEWKESSLRSANQIAERAQRSAAALKGVIAKERKRVGNGVCPCCNRTFQYARLTRHLATKHPSWKGALPNEEEAK